MANRYLHFLTFLSIPLVKTTALWIFFFFFSDPLSFPLNCTSIIPIAVSFSAFSASLRFICTWGFFRNAILPASKNLRLGMLLRHLAWDVVPTSYLCVLQRSCKRRLCSLRLFSSLPLFRRFLFAFPCTHLVAIRFRYARSGSLAAPSKHFFKVFFRLCESSADGRSSDPASAFCFCTLSYALLPLASPSSAALSIRRACAV